MSKGDDQVWHASMKDLRVKPQEPDNEPVLMVPCDFQHGKGWYIDHPLFYCDLEKDEEGVWSVFFRERDTGKEAFGEKK